MIDVNGRYIYRHFLVNELKPILWRMTSSIARSQYISPSESFKSVIIVLRITSPAQPSLSLAQTVTSILEKTGLAGNISNPSERRIKVPDFARQEASKMVSAKGISYSRMKKGGDRNELEMSVSREAPGIEFQQKVYIPLELIGS